MGTPLKRSLLAGLAATGLVGATLGTAGADPGANAAETIKKKKTFESTVDLQSVDKGTNRATGSVDSAKQYCRQGRHVVLYATGAYDKQIRAIGKTRRDGTFNIGYENLPASGESYTVEARKKVQKKVRRKENGDKVVKKKVCERAISAPLTPSP